MKSLATALILSLSVGLMACQAQGSASAAAGPGDVAAEAQLLERLRTEIGSAPCTSDAQCRTLGVGAKACGGPAAWWPWSDANTRADRLQAWALELDQLQRERLARSGQLSNCMVVPDPGARCVARRCVLNDRASAR
ncbi:MAG: hypothetical protein IPI03_19075 [Rubrivivax sp.]|nr:hypothetical protein [Rubrivivax sp.]MBK7263836.1 hypothetical protein [Rubrivivax sp.]